MPISVAAKLQIKPGSTVAVVARPESVTLDLSDEVRTTKESSRADAVIAFAINRAALDSTASPAIAAREDRLAWIVYPKAGKLNTDLNREVDPKVRQAPPFR